MSGVRLDAGTGDALIFAITETSFDPYEEPHGATGFLRIEKQIISILLPLLDVTAAD